MKKRVCPFHRMYPDMKYDGCTCTSERDKQRIDEFNKRIKKVVRDLGVK